jgi:hypothetical protein
MPLPVSYTTYVPERPLHEQLEPLSNPTPAVVNLLGIPYKIGVVTFKPLKVNKIILNLSLTVESAVGSSKEKGVYIYDKYTFAVKSKDNDEINLKEVPAEEIEETITKIFQSSAYKP